MYGKIQTKNFLKKLETHGLDCLLLINGGSTQFDPHFYYFTGLREYESSFAIIKKAPKIWVPEFELERAQQESWVKEVNALPEKKVLRTIVNDIKGCKVGVNGNFLPLRLHNKLRGKGIHVIDISKQLQKFRAIKTKIYSFFGSAMRQRTSFGGYFGSASWTSISYIF